MTCRRREVVLAVPAVVLASGCMDTSGVTDLTVSNERQDVVSLSIQVKTLEEENTLFDRSVELDPGESKDFEEVVSGSRVTVTVTLEDGSRSTYEWNDGENDASGLSVTLVPDSIRFEEFVR